MTNICVRILRLPDARCRLVPADTTTDHAKALNRNKVPPNRNSSIAQWMPGLIATKRLGRSLKDLRETSSALELSLDGSTAGLKRSRVKPEADASCSFLRHLLPACKESTHHHCFACRPVGGGTPTTTPPPVVLATGRLA